MREKKKPKGSLQDSGGNIIDKDMEAFAAILAEPNEEQYHGNLEPFEEYVQHVKEKICGEAPVFCQRFAGGYSVLIEELNKESLKDKPPSV